VQHKTTHIEDTFAEAFGMRFARLIVTADDAFWLDAACREAAGCATSVIGCDAEAGIECGLPADDTPDGRPGAALLLFGFSSDKLGEAVRRRTAQCLLTCPTTAVYDGLPESEKRIPLGKHLRYFGDGFQKSKLVAGRRYWRVPVMDGEFLVEENIGVGKGVAGGNLILHGRTQGAALAAARRANEAVAELKGVIAPFPAGVVRAGSKVGSRYKQLNASTNEAYCPTLVGRVPTSLHADATCAYEMVFDGVDTACVGLAMARATDAAAGEGIAAISAGNYGGKLGKYHLHLRQVLQEHGVGG
jgi:formylmethanofuran--tetrahydromethanopterin N-formyltransferase